MGHGFLPKRAKTPAKLARISPIGPEMPANDEYNIAKTPVVNVGQPVLARVGFRWQSRR
jgi:hypothetical protein